MKPSLVIIECAGYIFCQLFLWDVYILHGSYFGQKYSSVYTSSENVSPL